MAYSFPEIVALLDPQPPLQGFERCIFEQYEMTVAEAVGRLWTGWDSGASTFESYVGVPHNLTLKIRQYAESMPGAAAIRPIAFRRSCLATLWPEKYPAINPPDDLIVIDGNNRLAALALRKASGCTDSLLVRVFVGR